MSYSKECVDFLESIGIIVFRNGYINLDSPEKIHNPTEYIEIARSLNEDSRYTPVVDVFPCVRYYNHGREEETYYEHKIMYKIRLDKSHIITCIKEMIDELESSIPNKEKELKYFKKTLKTLNKIVDNI